MTSCCLILFRFRGWPVFRCAPSGSCLFVPVSRKGGCRSQTVSGADLLHLSSPVGFAVRLNDVSNWGLWIFGGAIVVSRCVQG